MAHPVSITDRETLRLVDRPPLRQVLPSLDLGSSILSGSESFLHLYFIIPCLVRNVSFFRLTFQPRSDPTGPLIHS